MNLNLVQECLTWEAWVVHQVLELLEELAVLVLPSRRYLLHITTTGIVQGVFFNWSALKMMKCQTLRKF